MFGDAFMAENEKKDYGFGTMAVKKEVKEELQKVKIIPDETDSSVVQRLIKFYKDNKDKV